MAKAGGFQIMVGDGVLLCFVKPVVAGISAVMKRRGLVSKHDVGRWFLKRQQVWSNDCRRFWSFVYCVGRLAWQRKVGGLLRVGLFAKSKKKRHLVRLVVLLDALNVVLFIRVRRRLSRITHRECRERLRKYVVFRQKKLDRVYPVRRMGRKKKKVK